MFSFSRTQEGFLLVRKEDLLLVQELVVLQEGGILFYARRINFLVQEEGPRLL